MKVYILCYCILFLSYQSPAQSSRLPESHGPVLPGILPDQLRQYRDKEDLTGWIYYQIQWVAKAPAARAAQLEKAVTGAWRNPSSNEEMQAWLDLLSNQGYALLMSGDIVHSTDAYTAAFEWARDHREIVDEGMVLENILKPLGNNYTRLGDYEQALYIHNKALIIASTLGDKEALAGTYSNMANVYSNMGQPDQALDYCHKGLAATENHSALYGLLLSEQADAFGQLRQAGAAK